MKLSLRDPSSNRNHHGRGNGGISPQIDGHKVDAHTAVETSYIVTQAALAKTSLSWPDLLVKGFLGGIFISLGSLFDLIVAGGATSLRSNNPSIATMLSAFVFPVGFVLVILTNTDLVTSNMYVMFYGALQRKISVWALVRNWVFVYIANLAGCLFFAGILTWWTVSLDDAQSSYAVTGAEGRVNVDWQVNFLRGIGCNFLVGLAMFLASSAKDLISKIFGIWIPIWTFVALGYQHSIANFFLVPIGQFYGTNFSTGKFIYQSVIPVTLGNIVGGAILVGLPFWWLYGRNLDESNASGQFIAGGRQAHPGDDHSSDSTLAGGNDQRRQKRPDDMV